MSTPATRILHVHIPKTAGTALRFALEAAIGPGCRRFPFHHELKLEECNADEWDLISGHFGYGRLAPLGGRTVALLRHPVDRFVSAYFYWREMRSKKLSDGRQTVFATKFTIDQFVLMRDEVSLIEQFYNAMTWQMADTFRLNQRFAVREAGTTDEELLARAVRNLQACDVIGVQAHMDAFTAQFERRIGLPLKMERLNVTETRISVEELAPRTRDRIIDWMYLDMELYQAACALAARR